MGLNRIFKTSMIIVTSFAWVACSHTKTVEIAPEASKVGKANGFSMTVENLKDKKKKFLFDVTFTNNSATDAVINLNDLHCFRGTVEGSVIHNFMNNGTDMIDLAAGGKKRSSMTCNLRGRATGDFKFSIALISVNPSKDRKTPGKALDKDVEWSMKD